MNYTLKGLYNQVAGTDHLGFDSYLAEKFADLILAKCIKALNDRGETYSAYLLEKEFEVQS